MTVDGHHHKKRADAGKAVQRLLSERLAATPPETTGQTVVIGRLGGLAVTGQALTTVADEVRVAIPDASVELAYPSHEWEVAEPSAILTRLERHLHRLPEALAAVVADGEAAQAEAARAEARIGQPWDRADELAHLRRRQQELTEALAKAAEPEVGPPEASIDPPGPSPTPEATAEAVQRVTARMDALAGRSPDRSPGLGIER
jgi:hypothetical protein